MTAIGPFQNENGIKLEFQNALSEVQKMIIAQWLGL
jgi:hypothetical protein